MMNYESSFFTGYPTSSYHSSRLFTDDYLGSSSYYPATSATNTSNRLLSDEILRRDITRPNIDRTPMLKAHPTVEPVRESSASLDTDSNRTRPHHKEKKSNEHPIDSTTSLPVPRNPDKSSVNVHAWLTEEQKSDRPASQTEDDQPSQNLPSISSKTGGDQSPRRHKEDPAFDKAFHMRHDSYFDSLFQGQIAAAQANSRKTNQPGKISISSRSEKAPGPPSMVFKKVSPYKSKAVPPKQTITPRPIQSQVTPKNPNERYREALEKFRADRLEQQQRETNESTAKRMNYGKYVRGATRESLLEKAKKPLPWSDFVDMRKGNVYSLSKQEKRDLFYLSKSYGERVRQRNFAMNQGAHTARLDYSAFPYLPIHPKPSSNPETTRPNLLDDETKSKERKNSPIARTFSTKSSTEIESDETDSTANQHRIFGAITTTTTTTTESERETSSEKTETLTKKRENLSTVQEEKSNENSRTKKH